MLNSRQHRFVQEYLTTLNATQAARKAGYSEKTAHAQGCRLLKNSNVVEALTEARKAGISSSVARLQEVCSTVTNIIFNSRNEFARIKAAELLAKLNGWYAPERHEVTMPADYAEIKAKYQQLIQRKAQELVKAGAVTMLPAQDTMTYTAQDTATDATQDAAPLPVDCPKPRTKARIY